MKSNIERISISSIEIMGMLNKILEQIGNLQTEIEVIKATMSIHHESQIEIKQELKEIRTELSLQKAKLNSITLVTKFIANNWKCLIFIAIFIFSFVSSSVGIHKYFNIFN